MEIEMRAPSALIIRNNVPPLTRVRVANGREGAATKAIFDLAGLAFGLMFAVFLLVGLSAATRAAPINPQGVASID
jgi:hypothetical protein